MKITKKPNTVNPEFRTVKAGESFVVGGEGWIRIIGQSPNAVNLGDGRTTTFYDWNTVTAVNSLCVTEA